MPGTRWLMRTEGSNTRGERVSGEAWQPGDKASASRLPFSSQPGGAHPSVPCIRLVWRRRRAKEVEGCFLTGKSLICVCNRDSSVSVGSTSAWRAVNSDAWSCLTEAFICYLHERVWRRGTECHAPSILAASGPQALPETDIHWNAWLVHFYIITFNMANTY